MQRRFFKAPSGAVVTAIMDGETPSSLVAQARGAEFDGAQGIAISLDKLKPEFRNVESFKGIMSGVNLPFMFFFYRNDKWKTDESDESRQIVLLAAAEAGAAMIDVMGDLYDPSPRERTLNPDAIAKQKALIAHMHEKGAEVVMSSHVKEPMTSREVLEQLKDFEARGADVVKIVTPINTDDEFTESVRTTMLLHRELKVPFIHLGSGPFARIQRFLGPALGASITFAVHRYDESNPMFQPSVRAMRNVFDNYHWNIESIERPEA